jgi:hypothetical protein
MLEAYDKLIRERLQHWERRHVIKILALEKESSKKLKEI